MNDLIARLREQFEAQYEVQPDGCWLWTGLTNGVAGYGKLNIFGGFALAHRFAYELHVGPISEGLDLDHLCRNRLCVNPDHLEPVTHQENILRGKGLAAQNARKTHCLRGHLLAGANLYQHEGHRICRECGRTRARQNQAVARRRAGIPERVIGPRSKKLVGVGA